MDDALGANVTELIRALQGKGIPLPHEVGTFIAWEVCCALRDTPRSVTGEQVFINNLGQVAVTEASLARSADAATAVVQLLGELLVASAPGVPEPVLVLVESAQSRGISLSALCDELEAALVPLNRSATMRILGRLARDAFGPGKSRVLPGSVRSEAAVTADIDSLLGVDSAAADSVRQEQLDARQGGAGVSESLAPLGGSVAEAANAQAADVASSPRFSADVERMNESGGGRWIWALAVAAFLVVVVGVAYMVSRSSVGRVSPTTSRSRETARVTPGRSRAEGVHGFDVDSIPRGAQVFVHVNRGTGSVWVERGVAHDFLFRDSHGKAHRLHIAADAAYVDDGALASLSIDAGTWEEAGEDIGPSQLPVGRIANVGGKSGGLARIDFRDLDPGGLYKFVATTPALLEGIPDQAGEFLYYRKGYDPKTYSLKGSARSPGKTTRLRIKLEKATGA